MLTQLRIKNFRLLRDVTIDFGPLTVFIGPNASGKSTVLEVLDLLSRFATDPLEEAFAVHGGFESVRTAGARGPIEIGSRWSFRTGIGTDAERSWELDWDLRLDLAPNGAILVRSETLTNGVSSKRSVIDTTSEGVRRVHPHGTGRRAKEPTELPGWNLAFHALRDDRNLPALTQLRLVLKGLRVLGSLMASPLWARADGAGGSARDSLVLAPARELGRQGAGLANVLHSLWVDHADAWSELERAFRGEFPFVKRIVFPADAGGSRISFAIEDVRFPERKILASEMSDGMVAYLALLAAIVHPSQMSMLGLDEPEASVHPSGLRRLLELAQRDGATRRLSIVTHSNALLDELRDPANQICVVEPTRDGAKIERLDAQALAAWQTQYSLSELRRSGVLDPPNSANGPADLPADGIPSLPGK